MARPERFELPTAWFVARYSIQLSYGRAEKGAKYPAASMRVSTGARPRRPPERQPSAPPRCAAGLPPRFTGKRKTSDADGSRDPREGPPGRASLGGGRRARPRPRRGPDPQRGGRAQLRRYLSPPRHPASVAGAAVAGRAGLRGGGPGRGGRVRGHRIRGRRPGRLRPAAARRLQPGPRLPRGEPPQGAGLARPPRRPGPRRFAAEGNDRRVPRAADPLRWRRATSCSSTRAAGGHRPPPLPVGEAPGGDRHRHGQLGGEGGAGARGRRGPRRHPRRGATSSRPSAR